MKIQSILIANRGEIAIRIAQTAKKMGIKTYGFLTPQEPNAHYLSFLDKIIDLSEESYVNIFMNTERIIEKARAHKIDAIHPGYGFLSEDPYLAKECENHGICYIGPSHKHITQMGNKGIAREFARKHGIPILPGSKKSVNSLTEAREIAESIGYPVIIKAVAGGGGKGMRVVEKGTQLERLFTIAVNEARSVFGNPNVFIEKFITAPKHIEVQVLADKHGNVVHLFERECSIQRKHQKLVEETPSSAISDITRHHITSHAIMLCRAAGYYNAGTVEFLIDEEQNHYFMEMNTRIQVEHPITEIITDVDLIAEQIRVAADLPLTLKQEDIKINGHAIEWRINAEDIQSDFMPCSGIIEEMAWPDIAGVRVDAGYIPGKVVPSCYDSLIAKLIIWDNNREKVLKKTRELLTEIKIKGIKTTLPLFRQLIQHPEFESGQYTTAFLEHRFSAEQLHPQEEYLAAAALAMTAYNEHIQQIDNAAMDEKNVSSWLINKSLSNS